jgi:hypothetical protein
VRSVFNVAQLPVSSTSEYDCGCLLRDTALLTLAAADMDMPPWLIRVICCLPQL